MQKVFNVLSVLGFLMSGALVTATIVAFARVPGMVQDYLDEATSGVIDEVTEAIPGQIDKAMPELPTETGLPIKFP